MILREASFHFLSSSGQVGQVLCAFLAHISPSVQAVIGFILIWLIAVRAFRSQRYNAIHRQFQAKYEEKTMTPEEAQKVIHVSMLYDMPLLLKCALGFALFKTYGIPSISSLLASTKELKSQETVSKRYADVRYFKKTQRLLYQASH